MATNAELQKEISDLKQQLADALAGEHVKNLEKENGDLKNQLEAAKSSDAAKELDAVKKQFEDYRIESEAKLAKEKALNPNRPVTVDVDGTEHFFKLGKFNIGGTVYTAEEAAQNQDLVKQILKMDGQGVIAVHE